jgi:ABC-type transport system involved in multi-copper enzyme maturation permease subunit
MEEEDDSAGFTGSLADLFAAEQVDDAAAARARVDQGDFVAAVIIPPGFSRGLLPTFDYFATENGGDALPTATEGEEAANEETGAVEVYANAGQSISASIVRAVVEGIVNQLVRVSVALDSVLGASVDMMLDTLNLNTLDDLDLSTLDPALVTQGLQNLDASILDPLSCLLVPGAGTIRLEQQPLDELQTRSPFAFIMIVLGSAQAIFFAMFTGIFGINSIYQEQDNWTLQRLVASPTPRSYILAGKLLGNVVIVTVQLVILFAAFTVITSLVEGAPTFIWGTNIPALIAVILGIALFVSGIGVLVVGLAKNAEQVQFFGPLVTATMAALGGSFGFRLPPAIAAFSPIWWGSEALIRISNGETNALVMPLLVLFAVGLTTFSVGTFLFKRRLDL